MEDMASVDMLCDRMEVKIGHFHFAKNRTLLFCAEELKKA